MTLKEAYRYSNYLDSLIETAEDYLNNSENVMLVTEYHMRSKAKADIEDEERTNLDRRELPVKADNVIAFIVNILDEKDSLLSAIGDAKIKKYSSMDINIDMNKTRQGFVNVLKHMLKRKNSEAKLIDKGYCFNAEGNQSPYFYDIKKVTKIDFNRTFVKALINNLTHVSDEVSTSVDLALSTISVDFNPVYNINDTFEELMMESVKMDNAS